MFHFVTNFSAYSLLIEDPEPCKEKGYVSALYSGIKRCMPDKSDHEKHIHLQTKTDYIAKLIGRAEPELLGRYVLLVFHLILSSS